LVEVAASPQCNSHGCCTGQRHHQHKYPQRTALAVRSTFWGYAIPPESNTDFTAHEELRSRKRPEVSLDSDRAGGWSGGRRWSLAPPQHTESRSAISAPNLASEPVGGRSAGIGSNTALPLRKSLPLYQRSHHVTRHSLPHASNSNTVISGRIPARIGSPIVPIPRFT
jgi:hypothetical protein